MMIRKVVQSLCVVSPLFLAACAGADGSYSFGDLNENIRITGGSQTADVSAHEQGKYYYRAEQFGLAVKYFEEAVANSPNAIDSLNGLAASYDRLGRHDLAERYYRRALAIDPENPQTLNNLGYSYLLQNRTDLAVAYLRDAQRLDSDSQIVFANRKIAEEAYAKQDLAESEERLAALPLEPVASAPIDELSAQPKSADVQETDYAAELVSGLTVHQPWIERSTAQVQTLVTQPQVASAGLIQSGAVDPDVVTVTSVVEKPIDRLPDPIKADNQRTSSAVEPEVSKRVGGSVILEEGEFLVPLTDENVAVSAVAERSYVEIVSLENVSEENPVSVQISEVNNEIGSEGATEVPGADFSASFASAEPVIQVAMLFEQPKQLEVERTELAALPSEGLSAELPENGQDKLLPSDGIEVSNGAGRLNMAARMRKFLKEQGISVYRLTNADRFNHMVTTIFYRDGWYSVARRLADLLPAEVQMEMVDSQVSNVRLELGGDLLEFDRDLYFSEKRLVSGTAG